MASALVIGGTGYVGRHAVTEFREADYAVTALSRTTPGDRFTDRQGVEHVTADRTAPGALEGVADRVEPDVVVDCAAYYPDDVRTAVEAFAAVDAYVYVYVSSGAVYARQEIPKREAATPLHDCTAAQATDDSMATYGPRKAECDRLARAAADRGVAATSVRPTVIYGPHTTDHARLAEAPTWASDMPGIHTHHDYWVDRVDRYDRVIVPGDGTAIWHRAYVEDVASAIRLVAEAGEAGAAYNVADRRVCTIDDVVESIADALDTTVEVVHASRRELASVGLDPNDFALYHHPMTEYPHVLDTCKLAALGWESTPVDTAMERTVAASLASDRDGSAHDPGRAAEEELLDRFAGS